MGQDRYRWAKRRAGLDEGKAGWGSSGLTEQAPTPRCPAGVLWSGPWGRRHRLWARSTGGKWVVVL